MTYLLPLRLATPSPCVVPPIIPFPVWSSSAPAAIVVIDKGPEDSSTHFRSRPRTPPILIFKERRRESSVFFARLTILRAASVERFRLVFAIATDGVGRPCFGRGS